MKKPLLTIILIVFAAITNFAQQNKSHVPYAIDSIKAFLYYETQGTFSKEITNDFTLWNTVIGEGSAEYLSNSTFVKVKITRMFKEGEFNRKIRFTATLDGKVVLKQLSDFYLHDDRYTWYAGFWIYDTGCGQLKLTAEIIEEKTVQGKVSQKIEAKRERTIPFNCGE
jgi:hypothetical protein